MFEKDWGKFWKKISIGQTPSTTPIDENFWRLLPKNSLILEAGCGWGRVIFECLKRNFKVIGIEINKNEVDALNKKLSDLKLDDGKKVYNEDIRCTSFKDNTFSAAIMQGILSALPKEERSAGLQEINRVLKPKGYVHVAEFELISNDLKAVERYKKDEMITNEFGTLSVRDKNGNELYRTHNFSEKELVSLLKKHGFKVISFERSSFTSYHGNKKPGLLIIAQKV